LEKKLDKLIEIILTLGLGAMIGLLIFGDEGYQKGYKNGQIDAINGIIKYEEIITVKTDTIKVWKVNLPQLKQGACKSQVD
jgi:hypothetical protein